MVGSTSIMSSLLPPHPVRNTAGIAREDLGLKVEEEAVLKDLGYSVDVLLRELGVCVEFDGPSHFITDLSSGLDSRFNGSPSSPLQHPLIVLPVPT